MNGPWISRTLAFLLALAAVAWLAPATAARQASPASEAPAGPGLGDSVRLVQAVTTGGHVEIGTVTVTALEDPYLGPAFQQPNPGFRFVQADVTIANTSDVPYPINDWEFAAVDAGGRYSTGQTPIYESSVQEDEGRPPFGNTVFGDFEAVFPGETRSGLILFEVAAGVDLAQIILYDTTDEVDALIVALDLRRQRPGFGDPVRGGGIEDGSAVVFAAFAPADPYGADDAATPVDAGFRRVGLTVLVENVGIEPTRVDRYDFVLLDGDGFVVSTDDFERSPAAELAEPGFAGGELAPGQSTTGFLGFTVRADAEIAAVAFHPDFSHFLVLAEAAIPPSNPLPKPEPREVVEGPYGPVVVTPGCEGVVEWGMALSDRFMRLDELGEEPLPEDLATADPAVVREVAQMLRSLAEEQAASNPPDIARPANDALVALFTLMADGFDGIAAAIESGDQARIDAAVADLEESVTSFEAEHWPALENLSTACPEFDEIG